MADVPSRRGYLYKRKNQYAGVCTKIRRRVVHKGGECNISRRHVMRQRIRLIQDLFTTMVDLPWHWTLSVLSLSFFITWFVFGVMWWLIALAHGDLEPAHLPPFQADIGWTPCVTNIYNFTSCFMFSMENQHTTGFGARMPTEECPEAIFVMCAQAIVGVTIQTAMLGIVFAKVIRPKQRTKTILFSDNAVICKRDGDLCFMFRVADMRKSHIIEAKMHVLFVRRRFTAEGEMVAPYRCHLSVDGYRGKSHFFMLWPETVVHRIDKTSPLFLLSAENLQRASFEIVVVLEGTIESTDQRIQARSSYLPHEILWGHRFQPLMDYNCAKQNYEVDYSLLNKTLPVNTSVYSAKDLLVADRKREDLSQSNGIELFDRSSLSSDDDQTDSVAQSPPV